MENIDKNIVVTMTSWPERVKRDIRGTINSILNGTVAPYKLYLTLSEEEWQDCMDTDALDRFKELSKMEEEHDNFEIYFVPGPNTKCFKKLIPVMEIFEADKDDTVFITVDDDIIYPERFVELMYAKYCEDPSRPVTASYFQRNGVLFMWGGAALYSPEHLAGYADFLDDDIIATYEDDWFYTYVLLLNNIKPVIAPDEIYYTPQRYIQAIYDVQMFCGDVYKSRTTEEVLEEKLNARGQSFAALADRLFAKYKNSL